MSRWIPQLAALAVLVGGEARAVDVHVSSRTVGQGYQMITSGGDVLKRSRLNQFLGLDVFDITGDGTNQVSFVSSFRFDGDFGITDAETESIPQLQNNQLSIMYLYVDVQRLAGQVDLRLGRQLLIDDMDFTMFDGLKTSWKLPWYFGLEVVAGLEVKNAGFLDVISTTQLEVDGAGANDAAIDEDLGIVIGASAFLHGLRDHHGKAGYRRIMNPNGDVDAERIFANYHVRPLTWLHLGAAAAWDLLIADVSDLRADVRFRRLADLVDIELAYWRLVPTFEGSSIFNVFAAEPMNDVDLRVRFHPSKTVSTYVGGYVRLFGNDKDADDTIEDEGIKDFGTRVGARAQLSRFGNIGVDASYQTGYGDYAVVDVHGGYGFLDGVLRVDGRFTAVVFDDAVQSRLEATSLGGHVGVSYRIERLARFHLVSELNSNRIEAVQFRMFGLVDLEFWL